MVGRHARALLSAEVAASYVVKAASHAEVPAIVLGGVVLDNLVAALSLGLPPNFSRPVPLGPRPVGSEWSRQTGPTGTGQALQGVPRPFVVCQSGAGDAPEPFRPMRCNQVVAPHPQLPVLQGWEVAPRGAGLGPALAAGDPLTAGGPVRRLGRVVCLGRRKDLHLDDLGRIQLLSPPVVKFFLAGRWADALCLGIG